MTFTDMSDGFDGNDPARTGYRRPPKSTQFKKGRSGNPNGRPRNRQNIPPYEGVLGGMVTIRENGRDRVVPKTEAFVLQLTKLGLQGNNFASRTALDLIEQGKNRQTQQEKIIINHVLVSPGAVTGACTTLKIGALLNPHDEKAARPALEPWIVQEALDRMQAELTREEQRCVVEATHKPHKVRWPDWWTEFP